MAKAREWGLGPSWYPQRTNHVAIVAHHRPPLRCQKRLADIRVGLRWFLGLGFSLS